MAGSQPRRTTRPPAKALPGMTAGATARPLPGPWQGPCQGSLHATIRPTPTKPPPPFAYSCRPNQLSRHLRGGMKIFVKTPPPCHLSCLPAYMAPRAPLARAHVNVKGIGDGQDWALPVPDKAGTPKQDALNAPCHVMRGIRWHYCTLSTSCVPLWQPLSYKRRPDPSGD